MNRIKTWLTDRNKQTILAATLAPLTIILPFIVGIAVANGELTYLQTGIFLTLAALAQAGAHQAIRAATIIELID